MLCFASSILSHICVVFYLHFCEGRYKFKARKECRRHSHQWLTQLLMCISFHIYEGWQTIETTFISTCVRMDYSKVQQRMPGMCILERDVADDYWMRGCTITFYQLIFKRTLCPVKCTEYNVEAGDVASDYLRGWWLGCTLYYKLYPVKCTKYILETGDVAGDYWEGGGLVAPCTQ